MTKDLEYSGHNLSRDQLCSIVDRIESLEQHKANIAADIKEIFAEAKRGGFCIKALRQILKDRKQEAAQREEHEHVVHTYRIALGMVQCELFEEGV